MTTEVIGTCWRPIATNSSAIAGQRRPPHRPGRLPRPGVDQREYRQPETRGQPEQAGRVRTRAGVLGIPPRDVRAIVAPAAAPHSKAGVGTPPQRAPAISLVAGTRAATVRRRPGGGNADQG